MDIHAILREVTMDMNESFSEKRAKVEKEQGLGVDRVRLGDESVLRDEYRLGVGSK